jgi:type I restriction enzyme, S subunit
VRSVRLGQIAECLPCDYGEDAVEGATTFEVVKVSNINGVGQFHGFFERRAFREDQLSKLLVNQGELLVVKSSGSKANILSGKTAICDPVHAGRIVASNFLLRLRVDESAAIPKYLWYVLNSSASKNFVKTIVGASTYPNLKWSLYSAHPIPLPPLAIQQRIAEVLDRAEALRAQRRAALVRLDHLTEAVFFEMFGDPVTNPKTWPTARFENLLVMPLRNGLSPSNTGNTLAKVLTLSAITGNGFDTAAWKTSTFQSDPPSDQRVDMADFLICRGNGSIQLVGKGFFPPFSMADFTFPDTMIAARVSFEQIERAFLQHIWNSRLIRRQIESLARTTNGTFKVNQTMLEGIGLLKPPLALQREFAQRVAAVEQLRSSHRASLVQMDQLFASLQHRAFRGEL